MANSLGVFDFPYTKHPDLIQAIHVQREQQRIVTLYKVLQNIYSLISLLFYFFYSKVVQVLEWVLEHCGSQIIGRFPRR